MFALKPPRVIDSEEFKIIEGVVNPDLVTALSLYIAKHRENWLNRQKFLAPNSSNEMYNDDGFTFDLEFHGANILFRPHYWDKGEIGSIDFFTKFQLSLVLDAGVKFSTWINGKNLKDNTDTLYNSSNWFARDRAKYIVRPGCEKLNVSDGLLTQEELATVVRACRNGYGIGLIDWIRLTSGEFTGRKYLDLENNEQCLILDGSLACPEFDGIDSVDLIERLTGSKSHTFGVILNTGVMIVLKNSPMGLKANDIYANFNWEAWEEKI